MHVMRRIGLLASGLGLAVASASVGTTLASAATARAGMVSVAVRGTLLVAPAEQPGDRPSYAVALADGDVVPVRGGLRDDVLPMSRFTGRLLLPAGVTSSLMSGGAGLKTGATLEADSSTGRAALRLVDRRDLTLRVLGTPLVTAPVSASVTPTSHHQYVAAIDNHGVLGQTDAQLLGHVSTVGSYWQGEADGAISGITVPATVTHYGSSVASADCGMGTDFFNVVQEAEDHFPGINPFGGSDQLVIFVPPACSTGSTVGEGTIGSSFASGGAVIVKAGAEIEGTYAHEAGHNYGFQHANARFLGTSREYFGIYDVMGFALSGVNQLTALSTPYRVFQGITGVGEIQNVDLGNGASAVHQTWSVKPRGDDTGLRSVKVVDPDTSEAMYLDYRSGTGQDAGSAYAGGGSLSTSGGSLHYAPGVVVTALRGGNGVDDLATATGLTSIASGGTWTNASGTLTVSVGAMDSTAASVTVDYTPPLDFTTAGTPVVTGDLEVGGSASVDVGTWVPAPTSTQIQWFAGGQHLTGDDNATQIVPGPATAGQQLVAKVTVTHPGYTTTTAQSVGATVQPGSIPVTADPTVSGSVTVGSSLQGHTGTWSSLLSTVSSTWQWRADGVDIPGATSSSYTIQPGDVGAQLSVAQHLAATGYTATTIVSDTTAAVPAPVISPAPAPAVSGTPRVGTPLQASTGTWMGGVTLSYQWFVAGSPVAGATGASYTPRAGDLGSTVHVAVTGTRVDYPDVTTVSPETAAVGIGTLTTSKPTITGKTRVGRTLTARPGAWTSGTTFAYAWYADGTRIRHATARKLVLTRAQRGKRITVRATGSLVGYASRSATSAKTARVR